MKISSNGGTATIPVLMTIEGGGQTSMDVSYMENWNLVGLPLEVEDASYNYLFPESIDGTLYSFNNGYNSESELIAGEGYWLRFVNSGIVTITGSSFSELTLSLSADWNLISGISEELSSYSVSDPNNIIVPNTLYSFSDGYSISESLTPGQGYWIRTYEAGEITLSSGASAKTSPMNYSLKEKANTLTINGTELYFGIDIPKEEMLSYTLPPKPPSPARDIRFSGDTKLCSTDECVIEVMNDGNPLTLEFDIKDSEGWELVEESGNVLTCSGVQELKLRSESETFILRKSTSSQIPTEFVLLPAYPNPFNPVTRITYNLPEDSYVSVAIYNLIGQKVADLVHEQKTIGFHSVYWNGKNNHGETIVSGLYFYRMETEIFSKTKKLLFVK